MYVIFYKCIWILIHRIVNIIYILQLALIYIQNILIKYILIYYPNEKNILKDIHLLQKLPKNLLIIFGTEEPYVESILKLINWAILIGIKRIDFYDYKGTINNKILDVYQHMLLKRKKSKNEVVILNEKNGAIGNGSIFYTNDIDRDILITFLSAKDSKVKISEICKSLSASSSASSSMPIIDTDYISDKLNGAYKDPDLALYFGNVCSTFGALPWHIRLTEFVCLKTQDCLNLKNLYNALYLYANCQQRCGK